MRSVPGSDYMRGVLVALALGMLVVLRTQSIVGAVAVAAAGVLACRGLPARIAVAALGLLTLFGVPWIASPLIAGCLWAGFSARGRVLARVRAALARITGRGALEALALGLLAGTVGLVFAEMQTSDAPIVFNIVRPHPALTLLALFVFAGANAIGEELLWRGALVQETPTLPVGVQYLLQVLSFGTAHWFGLPGGWIGCLLTGTASVLFLWTHRRWGIGASILAHLVADVLIFAAVLPHVLFTGWAG